MFHTQAAWKKNFLTEFKQFFELSLIVNVCYTTLIFYTDFYTVLKDVTTKMLS